MTKRTPQLQNFLDKLARRAGISQNFQDASDHPSACTCDKCREWWAMMGPDPDTGKYGPFGETIEKEGHDE